MSCPPSSHTGRQQITQVSFPRVRNQYSPVSRALSTESGLDTNADDNDKQNEASATLSSDEKKAGEAKSEEPAKLSEERRSKEDLVKKFKLKPSAEVGIRVSLRERREQKERELGSQKAAAEAEGAEANRINRLFDTIQSGRNQAIGIEAEESGTGPNKKPNEAWKFLFDEDDLDTKEEKPQSNNNNTVAEGSSQHVELLDRIPGGSTLFPSVSEHRTAFITAAVPPSTTHSFAETWKNPKGRSAEKEAFQSLFASLFEHNKPKETDGPNRAQSLFSNFNRSGLPESAQSVQSATGSIFDPSSPLTATNTLPASSEEDEKMAQENAMAILRRQLKSLSERSEPIYLDKKPKTSSFQVMESTVGTQDWMSQDPVLPSENNLFAVIREENKVAIRMRKELEEKHHDITKVRDFVDELIAPFLSQSDEQESTAVKPSGVGLDSLLSQAIMYSSSTRAAITEPGQGSASAAQGKRSLHPWMGHAMVEHARRQGLTVFIRTVRTESYKALLQSRWNAWQDGPGCLEILKEMQSSGALVDAETRSLVRGMVRDLQTTCVKTTQGWGFDDQVQPLQEMLKIIKSAEEDQDWDLVDSRHSALAGPSILGAASPMAQPLSDVFRTRPHRKPATYAYGRK
ncbi:hypothetical protein BG004_007619 [Podila humilis]|nr:hypothetical protein BG004_007619 [Podila humilis]